MPAFRPGRWLAIALLAVACGRADAAPIVLRMVPQADLRILDPFWTTAAVTRDHGYMVYDTLFGTDADGRIRPEMVDRYAVSADRRTWTFTLRPGLFFHDGQPVTTADVIASLERWGRRDGLGQKLFAALGSLDAVDDRTFRLTLARPFDMVLEALGKPGALPTFIMPQRIARTPADQQIDDPTGSGPYVFKRDEYRPGERVVYVRNDRYAARPEPASGTAGGKRVFVDRVEWLVIKDPQAQVNALRHGDVDLLSWIPPEQYPALRADPAVALDAPSPRVMFTLHLNHLRPPFDDPRISRAAALAVNQEALLQAQIGDPALFRTCASIYPCGTGYALEAPGQFSGTSHFDRARALLAEARYDGRPIVLMQPADFTFLNRLPLVMAQLLRLAGFSVDLQTMDWATLVARRASKAAPADGGWNAFITAWAVSDAMDPMYFAPLTGNGEDGWFGWATDPRLEALKARYAQAADPAARTALARDIQARVFETGLFAPLGLYDARMAYRRGAVDGIVASPSSVYWNIHKH